MSSFLLFFLYKKIMGNINYNNFICDNYYCQSVSFKPEWLSEASWNISYNYKDLVKPYLIDKGILKINNVYNFDILFSKKLLIDFNDVKYLSIPINFSYNINKDNNIDIYIIFSSKELLLENINELKPQDDLFFIHLNLHKNKLFINRSFNDKISNKKIKSKKINSFNIIIENNFKILIITEKLFNNNIKDIYEEKYINNYNFQNYNSLYLSLYINSKNGIIKNEFIQLNFE
jgi:hypothetical protein